MDYGSTGRGAISRKAMTLAIRGEVIAYPPLVDSVAGELVAMLTVCRRRISRDPLPHETLGFRRER
jgi:hypothetical protein